MLNWLRRPKYGSLERREMPAGIWDKCPRCRNLIYRKELERNLMVCPKCGYHFPVMAATPESSAVFKDAPPFLEKLAS